jgi:hypothetical protein
VAKDALFGPGKGPGRAGRGRRGAASSELRHEAWAAAVASLSRSVRGGGLGKGRADRGRGWDGPAAAPHAREGHGGESRWRVTVASHGGESRSVASHGGESRSVASHGGESRWRVTLVSHGGESRWRVEPRCAQGRVRWAHAFSSASSCGQALVTAGAVKATLTGEVRVRACEREGERDRARERERERKSEERRRQVARVRSSLLF